jgi:hypothetical protein
MNKTTMKVVAISAAVSLAAIWAANNIDVVGNATEKKGFF